MLKSKKFWGMIIGALLTGIGKYFGWDDKMIQDLVALIVAYIVGQGIADHGKEAAKVQSASVPGSARVVGMYPNKPEQ